ncbi:hypothetical protein F3Y22_tig00110584pilonHSYRG00371 [Hibiscus syriacus]|uniref:Uncharacterized protein n=1 Tax=Hibiscus syriacus TaxID=106335 RepID=A0A6A3A4M2_HIBSY|nr:hypothetical protein F3Y22_tig00110584pilonHSYRG00371 [Hibiscus syriacus]
MNEIEVFVQDFQRRASELPIVPYEGVIHWRRCWEHTQWRVKQRDDLIASYLQHAQGVAQYLDDLSHEVDAGNNTSREETLIVGATIEEPVYPPGFKPQANHLKALTVVEDVPYFDEDGKNEQSKKFEEKWKQLENEIRAMKEDTSMYVIDAKELSLVPDLVLPPKFKIPYFKKFDGTRCPSAHITMFCRKMTGYVGDDQLLIHNFHESLAGSSICCWKALERRSGLMGGCEPNTAFATVITPGFWLQRAAKATAFVWPRLNWK